MNDSTMRWIVVTGVIAQFLACGARSTSPAGSSSDIDHAPEICTLDGECTTVDCAAIWSPGPLPDPWWRSAPLAECVDAPQHGEPEAYDDCVLEPSGFTAEQCGAPRAGVVLCESNGAGKGRVTVSCLSRLDCPAGMACMVDGELVDLVPDTHFAGVCEKTCTGDGSPGECVRCDMECDPASGLCQLHGDAPPPRIPCEADCECGGTCGNDGFCNDLAMPVRTALCLVGDCACEGGWCDERRCCHRPDGSIVRSRMDPMCAFPED
jgi:hypothetical protein